MIQWMFFYSVILIILCMLPTALTAALYLRSRKSVYLDLTLLFLCFFVELAEIHYVEFFLLLPDIGYEDICHITYPALRIIISSLIFVLDMRILSALMSRKWQVRSLLTLLPFLVVSLFLLTQPENEFVVWLFYSLRQFYRFIFCAYFFFVCLTEKDAEKKGHMQPYALPIFGVFIINCSILLEDSLVISHIDFFLQTSPIITERNFSENILWLFISMYTFVLCAGKLHTPAVQNPADTASGFDTYFLPGSEVPSDSKIFSLSGHMLEKLSFFADYYHLTPRETQILKGIIEQKSSAEISEELFISVGTVKAHTHNLYSKVNVTGRSELLHQLEQL